VRYTVRAITDLGMSEPSAPLEVRLPDCPSTINARVTIESLSVLPSDYTGQVKDDGDICILCDDRRLELMGTVTAANFSSYPSAHRDFASLFFGACPPEAHCFTQGVYGPDALHSWLPPFTVRNIGDGTFVWVTGDLTDYDFNNSPDIFCSVSLNNVNDPLPRTVAEWQRFDQRFTLTSDYGEAKCEMVIHIQGVP
jgi:hypothetical protein